MINFVKHNASRRTYKYLIWTRTIYRTQWIFFVRAHIVHNLNGKYFLVKLKLNLHSLNIRYSMNFRRKFCFQTKNVIWNIRVRSLIAKPCLWYYAIITVGWAKFDTFYRTMGCKVLETWQLKVVTLSVIFIDFQWF